MSKMYTGTVKKWSGQKGFGFIECKELDENVFVHYTSIETEGATKNLYSEQTVKFDLGPDVGRGLRAGTVIPQW